MERYTESRSCTCNSKICHTVGHFKSVSHWLKIFLKKKKTRRSMKQWNINKNNKKLKTVTKYNFFFFLSNGIHPRLGCFSCSNPAWENHFLHKSLIQVCLHNSYQLSSCQNISRLMDVQHYSTKFRSIQ